MKKKKVVPFFLAPFLSFYSKTLYNDLCNNWKGLGFLYVFVISLVIGSGGLYFGSEYIDGISKENLYKIAGTLPAFEIRDGEFHASIEEPLMIELKVEEGSSEPNKVVIDTTGQFKVLEDDMRLLVTKDQLFFRNNKGTVESIAFADWFFFYISKSMLQKLLLRFMDYGPWLIAVTMGGLFFIAYSVRLLFYSMMAAAVVNDSRSFSQLSRVTAFALTPGTIFSWLIGVPFLLGFAINIAYVILAVRASRPIVEQPPQKPLTV